MSCRNGKCSAQFSVSNRDKVFRVKIGEMVASGFFVLWQEQPVFITPKHAQKGGSSHSPLLVRYPRTEMELIRHIPELDASLWCPSDTNGAHVWPLSKSSLNPSKLLTVTFSYRVTLGGRAVVNVSANRVRCLVLRGNFPWMAPGLSGSPVVTNGEVVAMASFRYGRTQDSKSVLGVDLSSLCQQAASL